MYIYVYMYRFKSKFSSYQLINTHSSLKRHILYTKIKAPSNHYTLYIHKRASEPLILLHKEFESNQTSFCCFTTNDEHFIAEANWVVARCSLRGPYAALNFLAMNGVDESMTFYAFHLTVFSLVTSFLSYQRRGQ